MSKLVSKQCVDFIKNFEGFSAKPYYDSAGVRTLGYGMAGSEIQGLNYVTEQQATNMLEDLLNAKYATPIKANLDSKGVKLTQNQFDALVSIAYNIGVGGLLRSTLYRNICNGVRDIATITANFTAWSYAGGKQLAGLLRRRQEEAKMFFGSGNQVNNEYSTDYIKSVQHDLQRVSCLSSGEANATGVLDNKTKQAITQFKYVVDLPGESVIDDTLINALNLITHKPTIGAGWNSPSIAVKFIQWYLGLAKTGVVDSKMTQVIKDWQIKAKIWSASGADGVIREKDWNKILK